MHTVYLFLRHGIPYAGPCSILVCSTYFKMYFSGYNVTILYVGSGKSKKSINNRGQKRDTGPCVLFSVLFLLLIFFFLAVGLRHTCSSIRHTHVVKKLVTVQVPLVYFVLWQKLQNKGVREEKLLQQNKNRWPIIFVLFVPFSNQCVMYLGFWQYIYMWIFSPVVHL